MRLQMSQSEIEKWWKDRGEKVPDDLRTNLRKDSVNLQYFELNGPLVVLTENWKRGQANKSIPAGDYLADLAPLSTEWKFLIDSLCSIILSYVLVYALSFIDFGLDYIKPSFRGQISLSFLAITVIVISIIRFIWTYSREEYEWKLGLVTGFFTFIVSFVILSESNKLMKFSTEKNYLDLMNQINKALEDLGVVISIDISYNVFRTIMSILSGLFGSMIFFMAHRIIKAERQAALSKFPKFYDLVSSVNTLLVPVVILSLWIKPSFQWLAENNSNYVTDQTVRYICMALCLFHLMPVRMFLRAHFEMAYHITHLILSQPSTALKDKGNSILIKLIFIIKKAFIVTMELASFAFLQIALLSFSFWIADFLFLVNMLVLFVIGMFSRFDSHIAYRL